MYCMDFEAASCGKKICCHDCDYLRCVERCNWENINECNLRVENEPKTQTEILLDELNDESLILGGGENYMDRLRHPVLLRHFKLIKRLAQERIFVLLHDRIDGFWIEECCDNWFSHELTKEECLELSELFQEIANEL